MKQLPFISGVFLFVMGLAPLFAGGDSPPEIVAPPAVTSSGELRPIKALFQKIEVFLSPDDAYVNAIVQEISKAKSSILVSSSEFNLKQVAAALASAKNRNVDVRVMLDQNRLESGGSQTRKYLQDNDVRLLSDTVRPIYSNAIIIDNDVVLSGTCALTLKAIAEVGTLTVIRNNPTVVKSYADYWNSHLLHAHTISEARQPTSGRAASNRSKIRWATSQSKSLR